MLPDAFMAADGLLQTALGVFDEFGIFPAVIHAELRRDLPFLATTRILTAAVDAGLGRETAHELIKEHAVAAALDRREVDGGHGLIERLDHDPKVPLDAATLHELLAQPEDFVGTAVEQVARICARAADVIGRHPLAAVAAPEVRV